MIDHVDHIEKFYRLSKKGQEALISYMQKRILKKGEHLAQEGTICKHLNFIESGSVRGYYYLDGKEVTHWFGFEQDFVTSFYSFISRKPSVEYVQTMEESTVWSITLDNLLSLYDQYPELERVGREITEQYYIRLEERYVNAQFKTAIERYEELLASRPHILQRASLGYIASFLGISQETLSRIRSKV